MPSKTSLLILLLVKSFSGQLLGAFQRVSSKVCIKVMSEIQDEYTDLFKEASIAACETQVIAGLKYRVRYSNLTENIPSCIVFLTRRILRPVILTKEISPETNCYALLTKSSRQKESEAPQNQDDSSQNDPNVNPAYVSLSNKSPTSEPALNGAPAPTQIKAKDSPSAESATLPAVVVHQETTINS